MIVIIIWLVPALVLVVVSGGCEFTCPVCVRRCEEHHMGLFEVPYELMKIRDTDTAAGQVGALLFAAQGC